MVNRDLTNNIEVKESLRPAVYSEDDTGEAVDLLGSDSAAIAVSIGAIVGGVGDGAIGLQHSDESDNGFADVSDGDVLGDLPAAVTANTAYQFGYIGDKRYIRVTLDEGSETSIAGAAVVIKGDLSRK